MRCRRLLPAAAALSLCGCSVAYMDKDGTRHAFGTAQWRQLDGGDTFAAAPSQIRTVGLAVVEHTAGYSVALGWMRVREGLLANRRDAIAPLQPGRETALATSPAGTVVSVETVGLAFTKLGTESGFNLGYGHDALLSLDNDALVRGNALAALEAAGVAATP